MRLLTLWTALLCATVASAQSPPVKVYLFTAPTSGFVDADSKRVDSVKDVRRELEHKRKVLTLVDTREAADVVVEILRRSQSEFGVSGVLQNVVESELSVPAMGYSVSLKGGSGLPQPPLWRTAAASLAGNIEKWIKDNRDKVTRHSGGVQ